MRFYSTTIQLSHEVLQYYNTKRDWQKLINTKLLYRDLHEEQFLDVSIIKHFGRFC